jgi:hypothetical protein
MGTGKRGQGLGHKVVAGENTRPNVQITGIETLDQSQITFEIIGQDQDIAGMPQKRPPGIGKQGTLPASLKDPETGLSFDLLDAA